MNTDAGYTTAGGWVRPTVVSRKLVWDGYLSGERVIVSYAIPGNAEEAGHHQDGAMLHYLRVHFGLPTGGWMNVFVHGPAEAGKKVQATPTVRRKTLSDGRTYCHIDLKVVDATVTHRLGVLDGQLSEAVERSGGAVVDLENGNVLALIGPDAKFPTQGEDRHTAASPTMLVPRQPSREKPRSPWEAQLQRLLGAGWTLRHQDDEGAHLVRTKNGKEVHMLHPKPKEKAQKKRR